MERSYGTNKKQEKIGIKLQDNKIKYPVLKNSIIEKEMVGLYRDDGLAAVYNANGQQMDQIRKKCTNASMKRD